MQEFSNTLTILPRHNDELSSATTSTSLADGPSKNDLMTPPMPYRVATARTIGQALATSTERQHLIDLRSYSAGSSDLVHKSAVRCVDSLGGVFSFSWVEKVSEGALSAVQS